MFEKEILTKGSYEPLVKRSASKSSFAGFLFLAIEFAIFAACPGTIIIKYGQQYMQYLMADRQTESGI